jgi:cytochrome c
MSAEDMKKAQAALPAPYNTADLDNGQSKFALCQTCHTTAEDGPNMTGPNLHGVFGRKAASVPGFNYSDPLKATGWTWDAAKIDTWITDPKAALPGTKMTFAGLKDPKDRTDVIAYLMVNTGYKP